jgi:hypothetical protein
MRISYQVIGRSFEDHALLETPARELVQLQGILAFLYPVLFVATLSIPEQSG